MTRSRRRPGFTLIELVAVMVALAIVTAFSSVLLLVAIKAGAIGQAAADRVVRRAELARAFRGDVGAAVAAPAQADEFTAGPTCLILSLPNDRTVVYQMSGDDLLRTERVSQHERARAVPIGPRGTRVAFERRGERLVAVRVTEPPAQDVGPAFESELTAALGGDLR